MLEALLRRGTLITVVVAILMIFGVLAASRVPVQMIPDLESRTVRVVTQWPGATPQDVEKEILVEQEDYLRNLPGLERMISEAETGSARIELEFPHGVDLNEALIRVNNALSQVPAYPENVDEPTLYTSSFSQNAFMYYRVMPLPGNPRGLDMNMMLDFVDDEVRSRMERVPGVSEVDIRGGAERQIQILVDPSKLAERNLSLTDIRAAVRDRNRDISGGDLDSGKRRYLLRTVGRFQDIPELEDLIIERRGDSITRLGDVADIRLGHFEVRTISYSNGDPVLFMAVRRELGSNVISIKYGLEPVVEELRKEVLQPAGLGIQLITDDVRYVEASIANVWTNLAIGAVLASLVMFIFLRSLPATLVGMSGIPICTVAAFIGLLAMDRTINVISLAGVAFAIGMTFDNSIVVLESIERQRLHGKRGFAAAVAGVRLVWPAVLASTMTTVLVFAPVLFVEQEAGQLYSDIAIAITASILTSMLVAITVIPAASARISLGAKPEQEAWAPFKDQIFKGVGSLIATPMRRIVCISTTLVATFLALAYLTPPAEYLPEGEEAKTFSLMIAPPGYSLEEMAKIGDEINAHFLPYLDDDPGKFDRGETDVPALMTFGLWVNPQSLRVISETKDPSHIEALMEKLNEKFRTYPGMRAFSSRGSIISSNDGGTRAINLDISGPDLAQIYGTALTAYRRAGDIMPDAQIGSEPSSLVLGQPLIELRPRWERAAELGFTADEFGYTIAALTDGAFVDEFFQGDDKIDIFLYSTAHTDQRIDQLRDLTLYTPQGSVVPVSAIADVVETVDTDAIRRVNGRRTVTLRVIPPRSTALETGVEIVKRDVIDYMRNNGEIPQGVSIDISGASDQLTATREALFGNFLVAVALCYLLLVVIYKHWGYPWLIMTTVPLGIAGGIIGLWLMNFVGGLLPMIGLAPIQQPFDMITMLGFLILLGTVVNNPILIVDQALQNLRAGEPAPRKAVQDAVEIRLRPIMMTTITTICGLAPLVFIPGAGTELYRGVGAIVLFGLFFTSVITLTFLPAFLTSVLMILQRLRERREVPEGAVPSGQA